MKDAMRIFSIISMVFVFFGLLYGSATVIQMLPFVASAVLAQVYAHKGPGSHVFVFGLSLAIVMFVFNLMIGAAYDIIYWVIAGYMFFYTRT